MTPQQQEERKKSARAFVQRWKAAKGSEQAEAAKFWLSGMLATSPCSITPACVKEKENEPRTT